MTMLTNEAADSLLLLMWLLAPAACRRSDLEILCYCMVQWLCGRLPWEDNLQDPLYIRDSKIRWEKNTCIRCTHHDISSGECCSSSTTVDLCFVLLWQMKDQERILGAWSFSLVKIFPKHKNHQLCVCLASGLALCFLFFSPGSLLWNYNHKTTLI